jgi:hypothetical protein
MSPMELIVLSGIITAFTIFAAVLAWVSRADGASSVKTRAPTRTEGGIDHIGKAA